MSEQISKISTNMNIHKELGCNQCQVEVLKTERSAIMARNTNVSTNTKAKTKIRTVEVTISDPRNPLPARTGAKWKLHWQQYRSVATRLDWKDPAIYDVVAGHYLDCDIIKVDLIKGVKYYYAEVYCYDAE